VKSLGVVVSVVNIPSNTSVIPVAVLLPSCANTHAPKSNAAVVESLVSLKFSEHATTELVNVVSPAIAWSTVSPASNSKHSPAAPVIKNYVIVL